MGAGRIGRAVLQLLLDHPEKFRALRVVAVLDSRGTVTNLKGLTPAAVRRIIATKERGQDLASQPGGRVATAAITLAALHRANVTRPILVDLSASETTPVLTKAARLGFDLVLANKRPLTTSFSRYQAFRNLITTNGCQLRHEATVSGGLPVLVALQQLLDTGDSIVSLEGCLSGTLAAVLSDLDEGKPFSTAVREAYERGATEPDPREDLTGRDVARKTLILARMLGQQVNLGSIKPDSLLRDPATGSVISWLDSLPRHDAWWRARAAAAHESNAVLRYVARITSNELTVGLRNVPREHPIGQLRGSANQLVITSGRYRSPLVISGPGGGPVGTATGVLADLLALTV
jgi:homoserine dehydrogenase